MYNKEALEAMTVVELRRLARENGVTLSAGISKQGIVERLLSALGEKEAPAEPAPAASAPAAPAQQAEAPASPRRAAIVADEEDPPVLTPNAPFTRAQAVPRAAAPVSGSPSPAPGQPTVNRGNIPGTNKPVFSLEGVRAWHNPRTFQQPAGNQYTHPAPYGGRPTQQPGYGAQRPAHRQTVARFGPGAVPAGAEAETPAPQEAPARPAYAPAPSPFPAEPRARREGGAPGLPELLGSGDVKDSGGVLELQEEGHGYLHPGNFLAGPRDIYVAPAQVRRFHLHTGDWVAGKVRPRREGETHDMLLYITEVNGTDAQDVKPAPAFDTLTPVYPTRRMLLSKGGDNPLLRTVDLYCPIGFGQRALIAAPARSGKTALLAAIAGAVRAQHPEAQILSLLLGERPEEITASREALPGEVIYAGFDEPAENQARVAELALRRAMRLAERKKDVVLLVDSLTSLCRACNEIAPQSARILPGGLAAGSLALPKRMFGAARALREGGSLTVVALLLSDSGSALDQAIAEEFRGAANMELCLNADGQADLARSFTLGAASMLAPEALRAIEAVRRAAREEGADAARAKLTAMKAR